MAKNKTAAAVNTFGAGNLRIDDGPDNVTIQFDPTVVIGEFKSGNPKVCSTGAYRTLDCSGVRIMLHVIGTGA